MRGSRNSAASRLSKTLSGEDEEKSALRVVELEMKNWVREMVMNNIATMSIGTKIEKLRGDDESTPWMRITPKACNRPATKPRRWARCCRQMDGAGCTGFDEQMGVGVVEGGGSTTDVPWYTGLRRPSGQAETSGVVSYGGPAVVVVTWALVVGFCRHMFTRRD